MKIIINDMTLEKFDAWSGAKDTKERILAEGKSDDFDSQIEELYPEGLTDTQLNDLLRFDSESVYEWLGITDNENCEECGEELPEGESGLCETCQAVEDEEATEAEEEE